MNFLCFFVFLFIPGACQTSAPNIINIINIIKREGEESEEDVDKGPATLANIIDNYFEREEGGEYKYDIVLKCFEKEKEERKGIINICVYGLLIICGIYFIFGYFFAPLFGVHTRIFEELFLRLLMVLLEQILKQQHVQLQQFLLQ